MFQMELKKV